jgi:hypothetical protein
MSSPLLAALGRAGTTHVYVDTADVDEMRAVALADDRALTEIVGNTVNQPLVRRVLTRYASGDALARCTDTLRGRRPGLTDAELAASLYTAVCGLIGGDVARRIGGDPGRETR